MATKTGTDAPLWAKNGARLRAYRMAMGLTQTEVAVSAGIRPNHLTQIERGVTKLSSYDLREALANALSLPLPAFVALWNGPVATVAPGDVKKIHVRSMRPRGGPRNRARAFSGVD